MSTKTMAQEKKGLRGWTTRDLLITAVIGILVGLQLLPVNVVDMWLQSYGIVLAPAVYGLWAIPGISVAYIVRRPGAAFLALTISGIVQAPINPYGWMIVVTQGMAGLICELPFLLTRYQNYKSSLLMGVGVVMALFTLLSTYPVYGLANFAIGLQLLMVGLAVAGGMFAGWLSKMVVDLIAKSGVLNNFAIGQEIIETV